MPKSRTQLEREWLQAQTGLSTDYLSDLRLAYYSSSFSSTLSEGTWKDHMISGLKAQTGLSTNSVSTLWDQHLTDQGFTTGSIGDRFKAFAESGASASSPVASEYAIDLERDSSQYLSITDANQTGLDLTSGIFTIEFWFKPESLWSGIFGGFISKDDDNGTRGWSFYTVVTSFWFYITSDGGTTVDLVEFVAPTGAGTWRHMAITCDVRNSTATTFEYFIDTVSQGNGSPNTSGNISSISDNSNDVNVGNRPGNADYLDGKMYDIRVWDHVRTPTQISDNWKTAISPTANGLIAHWKLDQDTTDATSNGNDLTANGSPVYSTDIPDWS